MTSLLHSALPQVGKDSEIASHARQYAIPNPPEHPDAVGNMPITRLDPPGIDYREDEQLALLASWRSPKHQALFDALRGDAAINRFALGQDAVSNTFCNTPDAEIYAAMITDRRPTRVVEVGSGFSTLVARKAIEVGGLDSRLFVVDPYPRTDVRAAADQLELSPVEQTRTLESGWSADDILFIDSSHICRTRGDVPYLFCQVLPSLPVGVRVHVHDIFLPYDYPNVYDGWWHTEQYLLACMLSYSRRYRVRLATHWLSRENGAEMEKTFGRFSGTAASPPHHLGCSFWLDVVGPA